MRQPQRFKAKDFLCRHLVEITSCSRPQRSDDLSSGHWHKLLLLQKLSEDAST